MLEDGATVSTVHVNCAGVGSVLPAPSVARTLKLWLPSQRPVKVFGEVQDEKPPASSSHSKVEPPSSAENVKVASALVDGSLGFESIPGPHPVVPLLVRDTSRVRAMMAGLFDRGILAVGLTYPVVPKGDETIRFQINAAHTESDIDELLGRLEELKETARA